MVENYSVRTLIAIAESQLPYMEKASNEYLDDFTANAGKADFQKMGRDLHEAGYYNGNKNGYPWCDQFVDWCFYRLTNCNKEKAEEIECQTGLLGAGCEYSLEYYAQAGRFDHTDPRKGDQIFFFSGGEISHTGIVTGVDENNIYTVEGNTSARVARRVYAKNDPYVYGFGHPKYTSEDYFDGITGRPDVIGRDSEGEFVAILQTWLNKLGYSCGEVDGEFGLKTEDAVVDLQEDWDLDVDGEVGPKTWAVIDNLIGNNKEKTSDEPVQKFEEIDLIDIEETPKDEIARGDISEVPEIGSALELAGSQYVVYYADENTVVLHKAAK